MTTTNTGSKDALGRPIYRGPRGGLFVLTSAGNRAAVNQGTRTTTVTTTKNLSPNMWRLIAHRANENTVKALRATSKGARLGANGYLRDRQVLANAMKKFVRNAHPARRYITIRPLVTALRQAPNNMDRLQGEVFGPHLDRRIQLGNSDRWDLRLTLTNEFPGPPGSNPPQGPYTLSMEGGMVLAKITADKRLFLIYTNGNARAIVQTLQRYIRAACLELGMVESADRLEFR